MLTSHAEHPDTFKVRFGANNKALLATRALFSLTHKYGDILREGWKNMTECLLQLFRCQLLPETMMETEDFIEPTGKVSLYRDELPVEKEDSGLINSLVSFIVASSEMPRELSDEEQEYVNKAKKTISECHPEHMLQESKFLLTESLQELVKFLVAGSVLDSGDAKEGGTSDHAVIFYLEVITRITIANRDRVNVIWRVVCDHLHRMISASARTLDTHFQLERAVTSLLRLGIRLARKEDLASLTVQSLRILLAIKPGSILHVSKQVSYGLHELLKNNAANIHNKEDWDVVFTLLEVVGAGASPDIGSDSQNPDDDSGQGGTDDEKMRERVGSEGWVDLGKERSATGTGSTSSGYSIVHTRQIVMHCSVSFLKCCETLSFLVRDVVHITPENFSSCVASIRTFVEASYRGETQPGSSSNLSVQRKAPMRSAAKKTPKNRPGSVRKAKTEPRYGGYEADESSDEELVYEYTHVTLQLLDLMHVLFTRAMGVQTAWDREPAELWDMAWCPVLQGMARLCCDSRQQVRTQSLTLLQRSLLVPDLQVLSPAQWEFAFLRVLFPMLRKLLEMSPTQTKADPSREETKLRAAMMLSKVFLQHLTPLSSLPTFPALWLTILDLIGQFCATASTDLLADALPESLKNMLLVMDTSGGGLFFSPTGHPTPLWGVTWGKIDTFMPGLREELFPDWDKRSQIKPEVKEVVQEVERPQEAVPEPFIETNAAAPTVTSVDAITTSLEAVTIAAPNAPPASSTAQSSTLASLPTTAPASIVAPPTALSGYFPGVISSQPIRGSNTSLPDPSIGAGACPVSPVDPPVRPFTAFSLPTSPSHTSIPANSMFTPITPAPIPVLSPASTPLAAPRPLLANPNPTPGWQPQSPPRVTSPVQSGTPLILGGAPVLPIGTPVIHGPPPILTAPVLAPAGGETQVGTAFTNPLLSSAPGMMSHLPQFVASPPTSAPSTNSNIMEDV